MIKKENVTGKSFVVPATVYFNDSGVVSVNITIIDNDDSELRKMLESKTLDEDRSVAHVFAQEITGSDYLPKSCIMLSGIFQFTDPPKK